jgi:hypothetical protein
MHIQSTLGISSNLKLQFLLCCSVVSAGRTILSVVRVVIDHSCRPPAQLAVDCGEGWPPRSNPSAAILLVTWQGSDLVVNWCFGVAILNLSLVVPSVQSSLLLWYCTILTQVCGIIGCKHDSTPVRVLSVDLPSSERCSSTVITSPQVGRSTPTHVSLFGGSK